MRGGGERERNAHDARNTEDKESQGPSVATIEIRVLRARLKRTNRIVLFFCFKLSNQ